MTKHPTTAHRHHHHRRRRRSATPASPRASSSSRGRRWSRRTAHRGSNKNPSSSRGTPAPRWSGERLYESYVSAERASQGLKRGQLLQGPLRINQRRVREAFVPSSGPDGTSGTSGRDIFLDGALARNRALHGDVVVVRLLPRSQWRPVRRVASENRTSKTLGSVHSPSSTCRENGSVRSSSSTCRETVSVRSSSLSAPRRETELQRTAVVVRIAERRHPRVATGHLHFIPNSMVALFRPADQRLPRVHVPLADCPSGFARRPADFAQTLFVCRITDWPSDSLVAEGRLQGSPLGPAGDLRAETEGILAEGALESSGFPREALCCLPDRPASRSWSVPAEELSCRTDLRDLLLFTVDPETAKDLDDALSCRSLPDGSTEVGVHIADVSHFVEEGSALDAAAARRATSVYLVQNTVPMLPPELSEDLCSLRRGQDRLAFSVLWRMEGDGDSGCRVLSEWFGRSVIRSRAQLSYEQAQRMIDGDGEDEEEEEKGGENNEIRSAVRKLHTLAAKLRARRFRDGALRLDRMKLSFTLDDGSPPAPRGCHLYRYGDSNALVEEFMLLANMAAARRVYAAYPRLALLRRHPPPQEQMAAELQDLCDQMGLGVRLQSAGALHASLGQAAAVAGASATGHKEDEESRAYLVAARKEVLTNMCSRIMQTAEYFCAGALRAPAQRSCAGRNEDEEDKAQQAPDVAACSPPRRFRHYALNVPLYTHFTSPIRRYADILVHRLLAAALGCGPNLPAALTAERMQKQARHCNERKQAAKRAHEQSVELYFGVFVRQQQQSDRPLESEAMVMGVSEHAFDVVLLRYGLQRRIHPKEVSGVRAYRHRRVGRRSELTLVWETPRRSREEQEVCQTVALFTVVQVELRSDGAAGVKCVLKRPRDNVTSAAGSNPE